MIVRKQRTFHNTSLLYFLLQHTNLKMKLSTMVDRIYRCTLIRSLPTSKIVTRSYILYVGRVMYPFVNEITVTVNLLQGGVRDFSISIMKSIRQNKTNIVACCKKKKKKKLGKPFALSWQRAICNGGKDIHKFIGFRKFWRAQE